MELCSKPCMDKNENCVAFYKAFAKAQTCKTGGYEIDDAGRIQSVAPCLPALDPQSVTPCLPALGPLYLTQCFASGAAVPSVVCADATHTRCR